MLAQFAVGVSCSVHHAFTIPQSPPWRDELAITSGDTAPPGYTVR